MPAATFMTSNEIKNGSVLDRAAWPIAAVLIVAILTAAGLYITLRLLEIPRKALEVSDELIEDLKDVASAFRTGRITTRFTGYASSLSGSNFLQFATLERTEIFTLEDRSSIFWGAVELPEVVVSATAPIEYTAYLDLNETWEFLIEQQVITVIAPKIRFNKPNIDASEIRYEIRQDSLLRDEEAVLQSLKSGLTEMSVRRAQDHLPAIRELGRQQTKQFVSTWLAQGFSDGEIYEVEVFFVDETQPALSGDLIRPDG